MTYPHGPAQPDGSPWQPVGSPPSATPPPTGPHAYAYDYGYQPPAVPPGEIAGMGRRFGARMIDGLVLGAAFAAFLVLWAGSIAVTGGFSRQLETPPLLFWLGLPVLFLVLPTATVVYELFCIGTRGATLGKSLLGLKVVNEHTFQPIGMGRAFLRWLIPFAAGLICVGTPLVYLSPLFDNSGRRQGWHDSVAQDVVLYLR